MTVMEQKAINQLRAMGGSTTQTCQMCGGTGTVEPFECPRCQGKGCERCNGSGLDTICPNCWGEGKVEVSVDEALADLLDQRR